MEDVPLNYRIGDLTLKMIGPSSSPMMKSMGSETRALLPWAEWLCIEHASTMPAAHAYRNACKTLRRHLEILKYAPIAPPLPMCQELMDTCLCHLLHLRECGVVYLPKHHAWVHMTRGIRRFGNPMRYATFLDESLNLHAAVAAACAHRAQWEVRVFDRLALAGDVATGQASFFFGAGRGSA